MSDWDPTSADSWAAVLGMVSVPLFGRGRTDAPAGAHRALLDGDGASCTLSVVDSEGSMSSSIPLSWSWSSNLRHSLVVLRQEKKLLARRWDDPDDVRDWRLSSPRWAEKVIESLAAIPKPRSRDVIRMLLEVFWTLRSNIEERGGTDTDLIRAFNALLVWADSSRRQIIDPESIERSLSLAGVLTALRNANQLDYDPGLLTNEEVRSFDIGSFIRTILDLSPSTGIVLDPYLFIRHASGELYEAAHIKLRTPRAPRTIERQGTFFGDFTLDATPPRDEPSRDTHFTPASLARTLVMEAVREIRAMRSLPDRLSVLDPACGSGVFLEEVLHEIHDLGGHRVALVGIDRSPVATIMTEFCLNELASDSHTLIDSIKIINGDALKLETWQDADLILMNPPFVSWTRMEQDDQETVKVVLGGRYRRRPDYSTAFVCKAVDSLKPGAVLASIVPASFLDSDSASPLRESIAQDPMLNVRVIGRLNYNLFRNAEIEPAFLVIRRELEPLDSDNLDRTTRFLVAGKGRDDAAIRAMKQHPDGPASGAGWEIFEASLSWLPKGSWKPRPQRALRFIRRATASGIPRVADLFEVKLGIRTGHNPSLLVTAEELGRLAPNLRQKALFRPVADRIRRGVIVPTKYVFYPYTEDGSPIFRSEEELPSTLPEFYADRLLPNKEKLAGRGSLRDPNRWWELSEPRLSWLPPIRPKIVTQSFGKRGNFAYDHAGGYAVVQGNAWFWKGTDGERPEFLWGYLAILNSPIFEAITGFFCPRKQRPQFELYWKYSKNIMIPDLSDPGISRDLLSSLIQIGQSIASGNMPDGEEMDRAVAAAYSFPLYQIRMALAPDTMKATRTRFRRLAREWKEGTAHLSNLRKIVRHPAYQAIVNMGAPVISYLLAGLKNEPDWAWALQAITGEDPVPAGDYGGLEVIVQAWSEWGRERGYDV